MRVRLLTIMACILAFLLAGVAWLCPTSPMPSPMPTGIHRCCPRSRGRSFGDGLIGKVLYFVVQAATALILYTGGLTPAFNGFPAGLTSFVAEDSFLPPAADEAWATGWCSPTASSR